MMNVKKSIWLTLMVLLAACLCLGTAAATDYGTVFVYQNGTDLPDGSWTYGAATIIVQDGVIYPGATFVSGTYRSGNDVVYVTYPTASYSAYASINGNAYLIANGGSVYYGSELFLQITSVNSAAPVSAYVITHPNGTMIRVDAASYEFPVSSPSGTYRVQALFDEADFVPGTPYDILLDQYYRFTFTLLEENAARIIASSDSVYNGDGVTFLVRGTPGTEYTFESKGFDIVENQILELQKTDIPNQYKFTMLNTGEVSFVAVANTTESTASIALVGIDDACVIITICDNQDDDIIPSSLTLQEGWNFISVPKALAASANTAVSLFANIDTDGRGILAYNASSQGWEQVVTSTVIRPLTGYWIYANSTTDIALSYVTEPSVPAVKQLYKGWNAVGVSAHEEVTAATVFSGTDWRVALPWNLADGVWGNAIVNGVNPGGQAMTLGNGIWLYVDTNGTLIGLTA